MAQLSLCWTTLRGRTQRGTRACEQCPCNPRIRGLQEGPLGQRPALRRHDQAQGEPVLLPQAPRWGRRTFPATATCHSAPDAPVFSLPFEMILSFVGLRVSLFSVNCLPTRRQTQKEPRLGSLSLAVWYDSAELGGLGLRLKSMFCCLLALLTLNRHLASLSLSFLLCVYLYNK